MSRRRRPSARPAARRDPVEGLEVRVLFAAVHNDSFDVTGLTTLRQTAAYSSITGAGIGIAVLDTGVDAANPDLTGQVVGFYNAVEDALPTAAPGATGAADDDGHGSHVSGIAASADPAIGVAYGAHLVDVKVIADTGETQLSGDPLLRGLQFVAMYAGTYNIKVVNLSLGEATGSGGINDQTVPAADDVSTEIGVLESMGITVVAADGNSYANAPVTGEGYPAIVSTVAVGSTWSDAGAGYDFDTYAYGTAEDGYAAEEATAAPDRFSATSQRSTLGNFLVAPGVDVYSDWNGSSTGDTGTDLLHNTLSGTSMATPFVSGTIALMQQAALTYGGRYITDPGQVLDILRATADPIVDANVADNGRVPISDGQLVSTTEQDLPETGDTYDRVDVLKAVEAVQALFTGTVSNADTDDTTATATVVPSLDGTAVQTESGTIGTDGLNAVGAGDVDLYKVTLTSSGALTAALSAGTGPSTAAFTADVRVFDANGNQIAAAVGTSAAGYPTVTAGSDSAPLAIGVYYVGVASAGNAAYSPVDGSGKTAATGGTGDYALALTLTNPDPNGVVQGAVAVDLTAPNLVLANNVVANQYLGTLGSDPGPTGTTARVAVPNGDVDMFAVVAPDTGTVTAQAIASSFGATGADTFVEVFTEGPAGNVTVIGSNGQAAAGASDSLVQFPVTLGQTYYVAVTVYGNRTFSPTDPFDRVANSTATQTSYDLDLTFDNGNANGTLLTATPATVGATAAGDIAATTAGLGADGGFKYVNWYAYTPAAAGLLDLTATATTAAFSPNVQLWTLTTGENGSTSVTQVGGVTGSGQSLIAAVDAGQVVYVSVTGAGNQNFDWFSLASGSGGQTGAYALASAVIPLGSAAAKAANNDSVDAGTPAAITTAAPVAGNIGTDGGLVVGATDVDLYSFTPATTGAYDIRTDTSQEGSADTLLRLFNAAGTQVASNDNADGTTTASFIRADLVAGTDYLIGVSGSGNAAYDPVTGSGATDATKTGLYTLSVSAATVPAITVAGPAAVNPTAAAGATLAFVVTLDQASASAVTVDYATVDGTAAAGTDYTATTGTLTFAPGQTSATIDVPVQYDTSNTSSVAFTLVLSDASPNAVLDGGQATGTITNLPVSQLPFGNGKRATYADANGHRVTVSRAGGGTGVVTVVGSGTAEQVTIATTATTAGSNLAVAVAGGTTTLDGVQVTGSLAAVAAAAVDLAGDLTVTGTIRSLVLAGASGDHTLSIQGAAAVGSLRLGDVSGLSVATAEPLASLSATTWTNLSNVDTVTAPSIRSLIVPGTFAASLAVGTGSGLALGTVKIGGAVPAGAWLVKGSIGTLTAGATAAAWSLAATGSVAALTVNGVASGSISAATVGAFRVRSDLSGATVSLTAAGTTDVRSLVVGGTLAGSTIRTAGGVGAVTARAVTGSSLLAGVAGTGLPTSAADFAASADILSFSVTGLPGGASSFADSDVAAAILGRVSVRDVTTADGGTPFGFAADSLASFTDAEPGVATFRWTPRDPTSKLAFAGDFAVRVLG